MPVAGLLTVHFKCVLCGLRLNLQGGQLTVIDLCGREASAVWVYGVHGVALVRLLDFNRVASIIAIN